MAAKACTVLIVIFAVQCNKIVANRSENSVFHVGENDKTNPIERGNFKPWNRKNRTEMAIIQAENAAYEKLKEEIQEYHDNYNKTKTFFIFPGTKWCGAGDVAWNYNDLGVFRRVDICCRDHDHCPDYIEAFTSKYGLTNYSPISKLLCSCDQQFLNCLQTVNSTVSRSVGDIYFNLLGSQCFKEDFPIVKCKKYYTSNSNRCEEYELDTTKPKKYQYFDTPPLS